METSLLLPHLSHARATTAELYDATTHTLFVCVKYDTSLFIAIAAFEIESLPV